MNRISGLAAALGVGCVLMASAGAQAPQTPPGTALILGQVIDGSSERPMAGVVVAISPPSATPAGGSTGLLVSSPPPRRVITDASGRFVFRELPAGSYTFSISTASGSLLGGYGMRRPGGSTRSLELADGQRVADLTLRAWKHGAVSGTVVDQDGEPIVETRVTLLRVETVAGHRRYRAGLTTMTDDRGMYRIARVDPGEYTTYLPYSQVTIPLDAQATYDSSTSKGQAARQEFERTYGLESSSFSGSGLRIGDHLLVRQSHSYGPTGQMGPLFLTPPPDATGRAVVYPMTFYPNATALSEAATFTVESGQDRSGTDLQTRLVSAVQVSGRVMGLEGPAQMITVRLVAQASSDAENENAIETAKTVTNASGDFTFLGVPSGSYMLRIARVPPTTRPTTMTAVQVGDVTTYSVLDQSNLPPLPIPDTATESQSMQIVVGAQDIRNLTVQLQRGARMSGRLAYDGAATQFTPDQLVRLQMAIEPVDGRVFPGAVGKGLFDTDGQFKTIGLVPGRYMIRLTGNLGPWSVGSVSVGLNNLPDQPIAVASTDVSGIVVTLTDRAGSLSGTVRNTRGVADLDATVLVFPASQALWVDTSANPRRLRSIRVSSGGSYQINGLPAGDYFVVAIDDRFTEEWQRPQRLQALSRTGTRITVGAAEKKSVELTTQVIR